MRAAPARVLDAVWQGAGVLTHMHNEGHRRPLSLFLNNPLTRRGKKGISSMLSKLAQIITVFLLNVLPSQNCIGQTAATGPGSGSKPFTALHTYFMAASGCSDSYNGLSPTFSGGSNGPWCSPNHKVVCGDVIVASAGAYRGGMRMGP